ncbi:MAG: hypothetical protein EP329_18795 [Deltaproteobacteria bacterium]|nr:MAG: hypothetical protein EP329_18795 [Deltaproteobacteria bacterium]
MNASDCTLYSGAAAGAESAFGEAAERYGIAEVNFTFEGHDDARTRGRRVLAETELSKGNVSLQYVSTLMHRSYHDTPKYRRLLASLWHQVMAGDQVFCVGWIKEDGTVKGGTGWGAELAKLFSKPLYVFDEAKQGWFHWNEGEWEAAGEPVITSTAFTGTGTRMLDERGKAAIEALFERSFGKA